MKSFDDFLMHFLDDPMNVVAAAVVLLVGIVCVLYRQQVKFVFKSLRRNLLRTGLTGAAIIVLVFVVTLVWSVLWFIDLVTQEKSKDLKAIITERWQIPSQMPLQYASALCEGAPPAEIGSAEPGKLVRYEKDGQKKEGFKVDTRKDAMTWSFYGGTTDPAKMTRDNIVFFFCMDPAKLLAVERDKDGKPVTDKDGHPKYNTMMDGIDELTDAEILQLDEACRVMAQDKTKVVIGQKRLEAMNKKVGERIKVTSLNYKGIDLECEIFAAFPRGRYDQSALMNGKYLEQAMDAYKQRTGSAHPLANKMLNLVWVRVPDNTAFQVVAGQITNSNAFKDPAVKCETASSGIASFLDAYRTLLWGMRWLLAPAILATMSLVLANAISISVRERRSEMAVLKVLGFGPTQIMVLVLGEALLIGCLSGLISVGVTFYLVNKVVGGIPFPIAFFPAFKIPVAALWWGPMIGGLTALAGSLLPSWSARSVKVSEVFSKIS
jgi:putative ABC transport system permease protein